MDKKSVECSHSSGCFKISKFRTRVWCDNIPVDDVISSVEQKMSMVNSNLRVQIRGEVANILKNSVNSLQNSRETQFIIEMFEKTKKFISKHRNEIFITNADKGNETVIMNRSEYINKVNDMLNDGETFI